MTSTPRDGLAEFPSVAQPSSPVLMDLPDEVLENVVCALGTLSTALEVIYLSSTNRRFRRICHNAPLSIRITMEAMRRVQPASSSTQLDQAACLSMLKGLCKSFPCTAKLNVASLPLGDSAISIAAYCLGALTALHLAGCQKLTGAAVRCATMVPVLRFVDFQRCFQLTAESLSAVIEASGSIPDSRLRYAALSHLDLSQWPLVKGTENMLPAKLRVLALHNCTKLTSRALSYIITACPALQLLCLGGTSFDFRDAVLELEGGDQPEHAGVTPADEPVRHLLLHRASVMGLPLHDDTSGNMKWLRALAVELASAVYRLPQLQVLELTFCYPGLSHAVRQLLSSTPALFPVDRPPVRIWDLSSRSGLEDALVCRSSYPSSKRIMNTLQAQFEFADEVCPEDITAALRAAARCSSASRSTALHAAVEDNDLERISDLLSLGGDPSFRDKSGATPLFCACEAGHTGAVQRLLAAGANVTTRNASGEAPFYIAALRGHVTVVELLLRHCRASNIKWEDPQLYGDGWTPLHAATVAGRTATIATLLAGTSDPVALVRAQNRYGQTSLHLAARKGSPGLVQVLLDAGGMEALKIKDFGGRIAAELARRGGNSGAWRVMTGVKDGPHRHDKAGNARRLREAVCVERPIDQTITSQGRIPDVHAMPARRWVGRRLERRLQNHTLETANA